MDAASLSMSSAAAQCLTGSQQGSVVAWAANRASRNKKSGLILSVALWVVVVDLALPAAAAVVVPIIIPIAVNADVNPFIPALAATFAASFGFMLPVSTPQNAIVYGSGVVPITTMIRTGFSFDVIGALLIVGLLPVMVSVVGLG